MPWVYDPHAGGVKIPKTAQERVRHRIMAHADQHYTGKYTRLDIRFRNQFCYVDAYREPDVLEGWPPDDWGETREEHVERLRNTPIHLCRLRHFTEDRWSVAFYSYASQSYQPCVFDSENSKARRKRASTWAQCTWRIERSHHGQEKPEWETEKTVASSTSSAASTQRNRNGGVRPHEDTRAMVCSISRRPCLYLPRPR